MLRYWSHWGYQTGTLGYKRTACRSDATEKLTWWFARGLFAAVCRDTERSWMTRTIASCNRNDYYQRRQRETQCLYHEKEKKTVYAYCNTADSVVVTR